MKQTAISALDQAQSTHHVVGVHTNDQDGLLARLGHISDASKEYVKKVATDFKAGNATIKTVVLPDDSSTIVLLGLGESSKASRRTYVLAVRAAARFLRDINAKNATIDIASIMPADMSVEDAGMLAAMNAEMAHYEFNTYKEQPKDGWNAIEQLYYLASEADAFQVALDQGSIVGHYTTRARDLSNTPGADMTPRMLAENARRMAGEVGVTCNVIGEEQMAEMGMGAILGVSKGSVEDAQLIILEYTGAGTDKKPLVFLGKGITFDSGGLDLKPGSAMNEMHMDMTGAGSVIAAVCAIAKLGLPVNVVGVCPAVENMPSGQSYRPGDLLRSMSGKTIEVLSPDAEGRVVLADALTYTERQYDPELVVDLATLTGAVLVALGSRAAAVMSPDEAFSHELCQIGERAGDYMWPLPMWEEYEADVKGTFGDVINAPRKRSDGGTINGGMFLYQFAKSFKKWAHIDIASTMTTLDGEYLAKGASGVGVRFLVELARSMSK